MSIQEALKKLIEGRDLDGGEMQSAMRGIMQGEATPAQIGGFLVALRMKGESIEEIAAAARVMREFSLKVKVAGEHLVDVVGTGGDGAHTFNISTTAAFAVAAAGAKVAKHNNRSVSSRSGSADVLELAGVRLGLPPEQVAECIDRVGVGFMFAPAHHAATRFAVGPRKELGVRTIFNMLGPLTNPAQAPNLLIGVYSRELLTPVAQVMQALGSRHVIVVHSGDGLDEISISAPTSVAELKQGKIDHYEIAPERFGLERQDIGTIVVGGVEESYAIMQSVLVNKPGPARDIVLLNAGAALYASGVAASMEDGIERVKAVLADGSARRKLEELVSLTTGFAEKN